MKYIRKASAEDLPVILEIYAAAREFQKRTGNPTQWAGGYPPQSLLEKDIENGNLYLCMETEDSGTGSRLQDQGRIVGVFMFRIGEDPTYRVIRGGVWLNDEPYGVMHRIASDGRTRGVASFCFQWVLERCQNLRIDTHADNVVMQHVLEKNGFVRCGEISVEDGTPRWAYQHTGGCCGVLRGRRSDKC